LALVNKQNIHGNMELQRCAEIHPKIQLSESPGGQHLGEGSKILAGLSSKGEFNLLKGRRRHFHLQKRAPAPFSLKSAQRRNC
jgi:hypothetical protein